MIDVQKALTKVRPPLRDVDPKSFFISWGFAVFNLLIGFYFVFTPLGALRVPVVTSLLSNTFWAVVFGALGLWLAYELVRNDWPAIRSAMIGGLFVKAWWAYALIFLAIRSGILRSFSTLVMWFFIAAVQAIVVVYFLPKDIVRLTNGKPVI